MHFRRIHFRFPADLLLCVSLSLSAFSSAGAAVDRLAMPAQPNPNSGEAAQHTLFAMPRRLHRKLASSPDTPMYASEEFYGLQTVEDLTPPCMDRFYGLCDTTSSPPPPNFNPPPATSDTASPTASPTASSLSPSDTQLLFYGLPLVSPPLVSPPVPPPPTGVPPPPLAEATASPTTTNDTSTPGNPPPIEPTLPPTVSNTSNTSHTPIPPPVMRLPPFSPHHPCPPPVPSPPLPSSPLPPPPSTPMCLSRLQSVANISNLDIEVLNSSCTGEGTAAEQCSGMEHFTLKVCTLTCGRQCFLLLLERVSTCGRGPSTNWC
ncbi:hypothetical protein CYMTET_55269 [Cymbomonas tetramitiformis]|uniref:Uncharacterized protein n=1 Tax=Cymbomonas tetramitiformis TaxID=36881 RepID=A0AAE0BEN3_9CHLO|nr:hypothetical protein CYMTET_55269 [Cymbomonas tetramitiformis]